MLNFIDILYFLLVKTYYNFILTFSASLYILPVYIVFAYIYSTLITPAPVWANMIQTLVHTCRGLGCSIFIETNVKRQSNPLPFAVCSIQQCTEHTVFSQAQLFQKMIPKSVCILAQQPG